MGCLVEERGVAAESTGLHPFILNARFHGKRAGVMCRLGCKETDFERKLTLCLADLVNADGS